MKLHVLLEPRNRPAVIIAGVVLTVLVGGIDVATGTELSLPLLYLIPISAVTWSTNRRTGLVMALLGTLVWLSAEIAGGYGTSPAIAAWNSSMWFGVFAVTALLVSSLQVALGRKQEPGQTDAMTGVANARYFMELLNREIDRALRYQHPFSLVYLGLDDFKAVNDRFGHEAGDAVLRMVAQKMTATLRKVDVVARLGGDEFTLLLPESGQAAARVAVTKLLKALAEEMERHGWPTTFSVGIVTWIDKQCTPDELLRIAGDEMQTVKKSGKNAVRYTVFAG